MMPFCRCLSKRRFPHWGFAIIIALWCLASSGWATNTYHTNRVFNKVTFTIPGVPTAFQVCDMAGKLTTVVGPTNVTTNSYFATEYQGVVIEHELSNEAWAAAVAGYPSNSMIHSNKYYDYVGWVKGLKQTEDGKWGGYIWALQDTVDFMTSATNVWVSTNGVTNSISKVLVGTIGDYPAMATNQSDTGPGVAEGLTNWPGGGSSEDMIFTNNFTAYYDIGLPSLWIDPMLTNVCINSSNVIFTLITNNYVTSVSWSITPQGLSNGAVVLTNNSSYAVVHVGGVATSYIVKATAFDNTNIFGFAILNVIKVDITPSAVNATESLDSGTFTCTVTPSGLSPTYQWLTGSDNDAWPATAGNDPELDYSASTASATIVNGTRWFAPTPCRSQAVDWVTCDYSVNCEVTVGGTKCRASTPATLSVTVDMTGQTTGCVFQSWDTITVAQTGGVWNVTGQSNFSRSAPAASVNMPATSQFHDKAMVHENKHVEQWMTGMFKDLKDANALYTSTLSTLTSTNSEADLRDKIDAAVQAQIITDNAIYDSKICDAEEEAFDAMNAVDPDFLERDDADWKPEYGCQ